MIVASTHRQGLRHVYNFPAKKGGERLGASASPFRGKPTGKPEFEKMANLKHGVIVFSWCYGGYHRSDILELLWSNRHLTSLRPKRWPI